MSVPAAVRGLDGYWHKRLVILFELNRYQKRRSKNTLRLTLFDVCDYLCGSLGSSVSK